MRQSVEWIRDIAIALAIAGLILLFFKPIIIQQNSMQPSFYSGDYVVVSRQAYRVFGNIEHEDVIVFRSGLVDDEGHDKNLIKRVIGLPGDTIEIVDGYVVRNGKVISEPYLAEQGSSGEMEEITVEPGKLFVMGDNREVSQDSRSAEVGQVDQSEVVGRVVLRIFPFNSIKTF